MARKEKLELNLFVNATKKVFANGKIQITRKSMAPPTVHISVRILLVPMVILELVMEMGRTRPELVPIQRPMTQQNQVW